MSKMTPYQFYLQTPLYQPVKIKDFTEDWDWGTFDAYSSTLKSDTTYKILVKNLGIATFNNGSPTWNGQGYFYQNRLQAELICLRSQEIIKIFLFENDGILCKVGQWPSLADLQYGKVDQQFSQVLDDKYLKSFKKAIGLAAHGEHIGSYVHLRRVFENLIWDLFDENKSNIELTTEGFKKLRMQDKIKKLQNYLPEGVREMNAHTIYSALSKGIHELEEEECGEYFEILKLSIELILEERMKQKEKEAKKNRVNRALEAMTKKVSEK